MSEHCYAECRLRCVTCKPYEMSVIMLSDVAPFLPGYLLNLQLLNSCLSVRNRSFKAGNTKGGSITVQLTSCLTGLETAVSLDLQNRLIQTSQMGGQRYSDTSPFSIPCSK